MQVHLHWRSYFFELIFSVFKMDRSENSRQLRTIQILFVDIFFSTLASFVAVLLVRWLGDPFGSLQHFVFVWSIAGFLCSIPGFLLLGTHRIALLHSSYQSIGRLFVASLIKAVLLLVIALTGVLHLGVLDIQFLVLFYDFLISIIFLVCVRVITISIYNLIANSPESNIDSLFVLVYGTSFKSVSMVDRFKTSPHYNVVGFITPDKDIAGMKFQSLKVHSFETVDDVLAIKRQLGLDGIMFPHESDIDTERNRLIPFCLQLGIHVMFTPLVAEIGKQEYERLSVGPVSEEKTTSLKALNNYAAAPFSGQIISEDEMDFIPDGMSGFERHIKRIFSLLISTCCLIVFSPLFLVIWIAIKLEDGGPAIYSQERIGRFGRPFNIYKFRSMKMDAESGGPALYSGEDDPRLTKVGKFIRAHHLDELPQLWNVFLGDMAFVGPRPERKYFIDQIMERDKRYSYLYQIRPGVTSYATYYNGYTDTIEKMLRRLQYDLFYLKHRSWWFDIKVLWMTFRSIIFGKKF